MDENQEHLPVSWRGRYRHLLSRARRAVPFLSGMMAAVIGLMVYNLVSPKPETLTISQVNEAVNSVLASATPPPAYSAQVYQIVRPSLVLIEAALPVKNGVHDGSLGSGVVVTDAGDILTALHVVESAESIRVIFADGTESTAQVTAEQPENDIAVLRADQPPPLLVPAVLGNPNAMSVGDEAFAIGNPFGLYGSISAGVISGFERTFQSPTSGEMIEGLIQIDTAVNPGNSGGPLLNRAGHVVGIVVGILNPTEQEVFIGIGFAVPIQVAGGAIGSAPY